MRIYANMSLNAAEQEALDEVTKGHEVYLAGTGDDAAEFARAEIAVGGLPGAWLADAPALRWLAVTSVGLDGYVGLDWDSIPVRVTNARGAFDEPVAETCLAGLLAVYRGLDVLAELQRTRTWDGQGVRSRIRLLDGSRVVMLGSGAIARRLAEMLAPFHCDITTFGRTTGDITTLDELDAVLPEADVVAAILPGTPQTAGLLDARRLGLLKRGVVIVNAGRGSLMDEEAFRAGIASGQIGGAVLDVTRHEPLPADDPLWSTPNVILTQHSSGGSDQERFRAIRLFGQNLQRYVAGEPLINEIDWAKGY
ncbi:MAG TPA: D-2-hydroxyacid dehydrogenase [Mycobacteriales bacterium]|nr:D-2-hydroxyacid dehydrogenase [Mycobacteriales bacterium]